MRDPRSRAFTACISTIALAGFGAVAMAPMASAAPAAGSLAAAEVDPNAGNVALVDANAETSLTIHKYNGAPINGGIGALVDGTSSDGTEVAVDLPILEGVNFDVYQVLGVDLTTNEGWAAATALQGHTITQAEIVAGEIVVDGVTYGLAPAGTVTTDTSGTAVFTGGVGLYLVNENLGTSTVLDADGNPVLSSAITPSAPFLVTLPMTTPSGEGAQATWMYDVHVYPKNSVDTVTKTVADEGTVAGNDALNAYTYTIETSVTAGHTYTAGDTYVIGDQMHDLVTLTGVTMDDGLEFDVYVNDQLWDFGTDGPAPAGAKVEIVVTNTEVLNDYKDSGVTTVLNVEAATLEDVTTITNEAVLIPNAPWWASNTGTDDPYDPETDDPGQPGDSDEPVTPPTSNEVRSLFASVNIDKVDAADNEVSIDGVTFQVWFDGNGTGTCEAADFEAPYTMIAEGVTVDGGQLSFHGLQASLFYDGVVQTEANGYCLIETGAAQGYNLLADPVYFEIGHEGEAGAEIAVDHDVTIENVAQNLDNDLPLTGGAGLAAMSILGLAALAGGGAYAYRSRNNNA